MPSKNNMSRLAAIAALAGFLSASLPSHLLAAENEVSPTKATMRVVKMPSTKPVKFDWLADRGGPLRPTLVSDVKTPRQIGSGSWICSPAGFGKKSRCYSN